MQKAPATSIAGQAMRATIWSMAGRYGHLVLSIGVMAVLSRVLAPSDFGLVAMTTVLTQYIHVLADGGIQHAVVQYTEWGQRELSTAFWRSLLTGMGFVALSWLAAPWVADFYDQPELTWVLRVMSLGFVLSAAGRVPSGMLRRELRFRQLANAELVASAVSGVAAVAAALTGWAYWTLVVRELVLFAVRLVLVVWQTRFVPSLALGGSVGAGMKFGLHAAGFQAVNYWSRNADNLLIGRILGAEPLAYYSRAYALMAYPMELLSGAVAPVLHPALKRAGDDLVAMRRAWLQVVHVIALLGMPVMFSILHVADAAILVVWGPAWGPSIPVFRWLCLLAGIQPWVATIGAVFLAAGAARQQLVSGILTSTLVVGTFWFAVPHGIEAVARAYVFAWLLPHLAVVAWLQVRVLGGPLTEVVRALAFPVLVTVCCSAVAWGVSVGTVGWVPAARLMAAGVPCALVWLGMNAVLHRTWWRTQWRSLRS